MRRTRLAPWIALVAAAVALPVSLAAQSRTRPPTTTRLAATQQQATQRVPPGREDAAEEARRARTLLEKRLPVQDFVPGQVVVKLKEEVTGSGGAEPQWLSAMAAGGGIRRTSGGEFVVSLPSSMISALSEVERVERTREFVEQLRQRPEVDFVQPNYRYQIASEPIDPRYGEQWHYFPRSGGARTASGGIGLPAAWERSTGAAAVVVAVIDTGILPGHPDIQGSPNLLAGFDMISDSGVANDLDGRDPDPTDTGDSVVRGECGEFLGLPIPDRDLPSSWHGSHVAGTIGVGRSNDGVGVAGVNWQVGVVPIRVLGKCGGSTTDIADAIRWAAGLSVPGVPDNQHPARVINMSLGGRGRCTDSPAMQRAIDDAVDAGALVVVAAGNEAEDASGFTPASCDKVLSVAAADREGKLVLRYSNFGATVDLLAPGGDVGRDSDHDGNPDGVLSYVDGGYAYYNGTSMAAPHVAGVAALVLAQEPGLTAAEVEQQLEDHALPRTNAECPKPCGRGLLRADFEVSADAPLPDSPEGPETPSEPPPSVPALGPLGWMLVAGGGALLAIRRRRR